MHIPDNDIHGWKPTRFEVNEWLKTQVLGVVSTIDEKGQPMGATVAFSVTEKGELLIGTDENSRKSHNIDHNPHVAMTVTDADERLTVQLEGTARKLSNEEFESTYAAEHYSQRPQSLPFRDIPGQCHFVLTPSHIRFSYVKRQPWVITEFSG